jgi:hypothetical protein
MAKKMTMANKVREYTKANPQALAKDIAKTLGTKIQYVHSVWYLDRKKKGVSPKKVGRPPKAAPVKAHGILPPNPMFPDTTYDRIRKLEMKIVQYRTVISYLEHQLGLKDSQDGAPV